jgi:bifunctional UDP-N-acetylglucosamine pyrophosphorylase/glucosamine-1-phosphate N-acetyltransferase
MRKIKNILVLGGGDGTRFWPLKEKNLFEFIGKPLVLHQVSTLSNFAEKITVVASGTNKERISALLGRSLKKNVNWEVIPQEKNADGQAGAILSAKGKINGEVLIVNANDIFDYPVLIKAVDKIRHDKLDLLILAKKVSRYFPGGYLKLEGGKVKEIIEKPEPDEVPSDIVKLVVDYFADAQILFKALDQITNHGDDWYEQALSQVIKEVKNSNYILYDGYWHTIKYPWHVLPVMEHFLGKLDKDYRGKNVVVSKKSIIIPPVYLGDNVTIGDFVKIVGPVYIGNESVVGDYAIIRASQIGKKSLVGGYSEVTRSYVGSNVYLHRNYVGDSILGDSILMGAGAVTANYRFDQKEVESTQLKKHGAIVAARSKIGVNAITFPGVKIGEDSWIAPGEVVREDLDEGIFLSGGQRKVNTGIGK